MNVLIALTWPRHVHHSLAQAWFAKHKRRGFRTCPFTQAGFIRISSNSKFHNEAVSPMNALALLERVTAMDKHEFWPDDISLEKALRARGGVIGHNQVTDAYLVALAESKGGIVATLDRALYTYAGSDPKRVELLTQGNIQ